MSSFWFRCTKSGAQEHVHVIFHIGNAADPEVIHEDLGHVRRKECRKRRAQMDIFDAKIKQGTLVICSGSYGKKCDTKTKENESADFVGCFLAWGYSY